MRKTIAGLAAATMMTAASLAGMAHAQQGEDLLTLNTTDGPVVIELFDEEAPENVARVKELAEEGAYDNVVFHRVIGGFMAQTGDVQFGDTEDGFDLNKAGMGGSDMPDLPAEFSDIPFKRGVVGMARSQNPNSANSQFFIMFADAPHLNGQYTVIGEVVEGMDNVDKIKKGDAAQNGKVSNPDKILSATVSQ
ncbi:peptidylprolyl isomerase [Martelella radicis]|uniref:Peptidyl-prolyl cis-trans isomerase n=1 Tax=Martelella radicis TaxID=1397476 RepID=A0A7W6KG74_9HYPH|nr:peptidylprolyl isomerase [Martelella radicis]MBB4120495.1 peptidyl-prolyl cis-trans isomerase A (cyclophilin A) [Martelella radicis]